VRLLAGRPHVLGPFINVYNECTLAYLAAEGAERVCLPPELPAASVARLAALSPVPLELIAFGRLPLAISARCFHARAHRLHKDGCQFVCARDPNGLTVETLDGEKFLAVNGTQTLSHSCCCLLQDAPGLAAAGIAGFRLSPMATDMIAVARLYRDVLDGRADAEAATAAIAGLVPDMPLSNGFLHGAEGRSLDRAGLMDLA
jgi:collagenase-like PrtC family protease